jgi:hypothetical protein
MKNSKTILYGASEKAYSISKQNPQYEFIKIPKSDEIAPRISTITATLVGFTNDPRTPPCDEIFQPYDVLLIEHGNKIDTLVFPSAKVDGFDVFVRQA